MSSSPREIGTLIVVVLKAKNLPNKRHIGKQDPYCAVTLHEEKRRTKAIKRGGQHPEWDEEFRFSIYEDVEDMLARTAQGSDTPPPLPPKNSRFPKKIQGGKTMKLQCFADDAREPDMIGESMVDLTEVLTKGETDEWFTLMHKEKYCGEVYLELTFWSNEPPPEKKTTPKPTQINRQYGGPGSFIPAGENSSMTSISSHSTPSRITSSSGSISEIGHLDSLPSSLRSSSSMAKVDLYAPPYEQRNRASPIDQLANDFGELNVPDHRRRESFPNGYLGTGSSFSYDRPVTPTGPSPHRNTYSGPVPYHPQYNNATVSHQASTRHNGPRYSMPASSSGFMPMPIPEATPSNFAPLPSYSSEPSGFVPHQGHTPVPLSYSPPHHPPPHHLGQSGYAPAPAPTPTQSNFAPPVPPPSSASFHQNYDAQSYQYPQYPPAPVSQVHYPPIPSQSAPPQQYRPPTAALPPPPAAPPIAQSAPPQPYHGYQPKTPSPPHDYFPPLPSSQTGSTISTGSRPLPQQPQQPPQHQNYAQYPNHRQPSLTLPPSSSFPQQLNSHSPTRPYAGSVVHQSAPFQHVPPPPPAPSHIQYSTPPQSYSPGQHSPNPGLQNNGGNSSLPPPPPLPASSRRNPSPSRPSLPQPPMNVNYHSTQPMYQPVLPPPPPPDMSHHGQLQLLPPSSHQQPAYNQPANQQYFPGPPPRPPAQLTEQPHWGPPQPQGSYAQPAHAMQGGWK
ncbi:hypothetical protein SERLA73DRAFT_166282 [Serpula lacrymans var. lacrymans S7.3]|uniref:C2 domain-containing protein n=1 Tax=Serpula lacrymans var. lacrymans (strain S7.3) TaxID=936435 RepID=F8PNN8_SERL3|nr:hypothetical protein SERLA73DRAFT_166282 [Serpula lacrymans var. lacrymans S7.3]